MLLWDMNVRFNKPRDMKLSIDYGRIPFAIMRCVTYVRKQISEPGVLIVRSKEVLEYYKQAVVEKEKSRWPISQTR